MHAAGASWRAEERPCPLCGGERRQRLGRRGGAAHRKGLGVETTVVRCRSCGVLYAHPTLLPLGNPYAEHAATEYFALHDSDAKRAQGRRLAQFARGLLGRAGSVLEVGCGRGELLQGAIDEGWQASGIEMTPEFADLAAARGIEVESAPAESARLFDGRYDLILFAAVLEHLYDPMAVLRRARRATAPGGLLFVDVPNESSLTMRAGRAYMRLRGRDWSINLSPTFPPFHVVGFSPRTLARALEMAGYAVVSMAKPRWRNALGAPRSVVERVEHAGLSAASWLGERMGMGDGITCWARAK